MPTAISELVTEKIEGGNYSGGGGAVETIKYPFELFGVWLIGRGELFVGGLVILLIIIVIALVSGWTAFAVKKNSTVPANKDPFVDPGSLPYLGVRSDKFTEPRHLKNLPDSYQNGFVNNREAPYFPDVTNRVLHMENREKEAVRALAKINQERLRRAAEDTSSTTPIAWEQFWKEWKQTHPLDGEDVVSGFDGEKSFSPY
jgi:hypothetical protein